MQLVEELEQKYNAVLLSATDAQLKELELQIAEAKQKLNRDSAKERAVSDLKLASDAKIRADQAKAHLDAGKAIADEIQGKLNDFNKLSSQLVGISKEIETLQAGMNSEMMQAKHFGGGEHINFEKLSIDPVIMAIRVIASIAGRGHFNG